MPTRARINSEWRIDQLNHLIDLVRKADSDQLDLIETIIDCASAYYQQGRRHKKGTRAFEMLSVLIDDPIIIGK
jgi:hypothetical protein